MRRLVLIPLLLAGCPDVETLDCTSMGCVDGLEVFFKRDDYPPGVYTVEPDLHGELIHCQATIPLDSDASDGCSDGRVSLFLSGSMLEVSEQSIDGFYLDSVDPSALAVTVSLDGAQIGYAAFEPGYQTLQPNGPECEPTCSYASRDLQLD